MCKTPRHQWKVSHLLLPILTLKQQYQALCWLQVERIILEVLYNLILQGGILIVCRPLLVHYIDYYLMPGISEWDLYKHLKIPAFHFEVWCLAVEDRTAEMLRWEDMELQRLTGRGGTRPAAWLHKGSEKWFLSQNQVLRRLRVGILEKQDGCLLFPSQSCVAIRVKDWHVTTAGLCSCTSALGWDFQWCCKACTSAPESQQSCWLILAA